MQKSNSQHVFSRQASEVGSLAALESYHAREGRNASNSPVARASPPSGRASSEVSLSSLRDNEYLVCISDRVHELERYPFEVCNDIVAKILESISRGNSVLIIGEPGIGRRTLSLGLARKFEDLRQTTGSLSPLYQRDVYALSLGTSFWNRPTGEDVADIQDNIRKVFRLVEEVGPEKIILCIDDIDVLGFIDGLVKERARGEPHRTPDGFPDQGTSAENMLRSLLFSRKVICLCTCIKQAYERLIKLDTYYDEKFTEAFRVLHMSEPDEAQSLRIVRAHKRRIERETGVSILDESLKAAATYAIRYIPHRAMPEKAIDLLHQACLLAAKTEAKLPTREEKRGRRKGRIAFSKERTRLPAEDPIWLERKFVDDLIVAWCGISKEQLRRCIVNSETNLTPDPAEFSNSD